MTTVTIDIRNIASKTYPDDKVVFRSPEIRENPAGGMVSTADEVVPLVDGQGSVNLTPGPVTVFIQCRGVADNRSKNGTVPDSGTVNLVDIIAGDFTYTPAVVSAAVQARNEARAAAADAISAKNQAATSATNAATSASTASTAASTATSAKNAAATSATNASASAAAANTSANAADSRATAAASSASTASSAATTATTAKNEAASSATAAATSATNASTAADRAEAGADRVGSAEQVGQWASQAADSASTATSAASTATTAKNQAATSATNAASSATTASQAATNAGSSASAAGNSASQADTSASTASGAATAASGAASAATSAKDAAAASATAAAGSASTAETAATTATNKAIEASNSADRAESATSGKADLVGGKIPSSQIPEVALTKPSQVTSRAGMLALTAQEGDIAIITTGADKGTYILGTGASNVFASWMPMAVSSDVPVQSVNGQVGTVVLSATDVGAAPTNHTHTPASIGAAAASHTHPASQITGLPSTDGGYNTRDAADPASSYPAGVDVTLNSVNKGWSAIIGAASLPSLGSFVVVTTVRQGFYNDSTWQYLSSYALPGSSIYVRKWQNDAWTTLRRLTDDGHTHTSAQISDATSTVTSNRVVIRDDTGRFNVHTPTTPAHPTPKTYVDSGLSDTYTTIYLRPALFSGAGNPPSTIPGAVAGDWWINTTTMELFKITGV
ncbi:tail protein [Corynebacterium phage phi673]|uniref:Putative tail fiber protein n=1 Tax=Corynebacterium phage phi673 TaxID=2052821 RepID=A0A2H4PIS1_9CAUD|nr:tail protein [Corynebacterium phage phi673]ATW62881.1 putative tail fiber protein [Corynebacterium phage phi673]